jgi:hypothetical protein
MEEKELGLAIMLIYQMWLARNKAWEAVQIAAPQDIVRRSLALLEEWVGLHAKQEHPSTKVREQWKTPEEGWIKANMDGAFSMDQRSPWRVPWRSHPFFHSYQRPRESGTARL